jgi:hypothetical protein
MFLDYLDYMPRLAPGGDSGWVWIKRSLLGFWVRNYENFPHPANFAVSSFLGQKQNPLCIIISS